MNVEKNEDIVHHHSYSKNRSKLLLTFQIFFLGIALTFLLLYSFQQNSSFRSYPKDRWQAVFLDNGQVYFGHIENAARDHVVLKDIYYLQVVAQPLQRSLEEQENNPEQQLSIIKLGNEIHGPEDLMEINREHIILIENLRGDSQVVNAIEDFILSQ